MNETEKPNAAPPDPGETPPEGALSANPDAGGDDDGINGGKLLGCYGGFGCLTLLLVAYLELVAAGLGGAGGKSTLPALCALLAIPPVLIGALAAYKRGDLSHGGAVAVAFVLLLLTVPIFGGQTALWILVLLAIGCFLVWLWVKTRSIILLSLGVIVLVVWPSLPPVVSRSVVAFKKTDWARLAEKPKQVFREKPAFPESLYIQDDTTIAHETAEENMPIRLKYLDGVHLKAIALKKPEEKITLYRVEDRAFYADSDPCFEEFHALSGEERKAKWTQCRALREREMQTAQTLDDESGLPPMRYRAHFWQEETVFLWWPLCRTRYLDIYETASGKRIAWAERHDKATWWVKKLFDKKAGDYMMEGFGETWLSSRSLEGFLTEVMFGWPKEK